MGYNSKYYSHSDRVLSARVWLWHCDSKLPGATDELLIGALHCSGAELTLKTKHV
jgi:hypothetical protein